MGVESSTSCRFRNLRSQRWVVLGSNCRAASWLPKEVPESSTESMFLKPSISSRRLCCNLGLIGPAKGDTIQQDYMAEQYAPDNDAEAVDDCSNGRVEREQVFEKGLPLHGTVQ